MDILWLAGVGITHTVGRDHRSTDQAPVEHRHRTWDDMMWKAAHLILLAQLQLALDDCCHRYNAERPIRAVNGQGDPPLTMYPHAQHPGCPFHSELACIRFDMQRVNVYLSSFVYAGMQSLAKRKTFCRWTRVQGWHNLPGQTDPVRFGAGSRTCHFQASSGIALPERPVVRLDQGNIIGRIPAGFFAILFFQLLLPPKGV